MDELCFLGSGANTRAQVYNGGLEAEPPRGPGAETQVGSGAEAPWSWKPLQICA